MESEAFINQNRISLNTCGIKDGRPLQIHPQTYLRSKSCLGGTLSYPSRSLKWASLQSFGLFQLRITREIQRFSFPVLNFLCRITPRRRLNVTLESWTPPPLHKNAKTQSFPLDISECSLYMIFIKCFPNVEWV